MENNLNSPESLPDNKDKDIEFPTIQPQFDIMLLKSEKIISHLEELKQLPAPLPHSEILTTLIEQLAPVDFLMLAYPEIEDIIKQYVKDGLTREQIDVLIAQKYKLSKAHYLIISIEQIQKIAESNQWSLCKNTNFIYLYNGNYWAELDKETFQKFLGEATEKMGVNRFTARHYQFREQLFKQFLATAYLPTPEPQKDLVLINLLNGTFEVTPRGTEMRDFSRADFITYQLPFYYDPQATAPIFKKYLDRVLPDAKRQMILAEFMGYVFMKHGGNNSKMEKVLVLFGLGANGKSVFHEVVNALLGPKNVSSYSIQSLTNDNGYFRAMLANKLVNYASEINGNLQTSLFKQLASGEPVEARLPYGQPFTLTQYAKLIFNCNELPKEVEYTNAYYRRFLIVPFDVTISESEQDRELHHKIIDNELSGVFNWVLEGLHRLLKNKKFTHCDAVVKAVEQYEKLSDSIRLFLDDRGFQTSPDKWELIKNLYTDYRSFCNEDGFRPVNKSNFIRRLQGLNVLIERRNFGNVAFLIKNIESI